ncbi:hypothetical protein ILT06_31865 [Bacillus sp. 17RED48]|uniref:Integron cassette protein domain-containing protein n=1 Tax=Bacillus mycoides TaxID=1405 RepID=A0A1W6AIT2_BACMY|nr:MULTISPECIES: hypothetical protein [Bacillus]ARJ25695.1 hypothetical protein B7492_32185 [Bacillus mycoides]MBY7115380.1 hypothetical protein [Bacillus sp. 17RED48]
MSGVNLNARQLELKKELESHLETLKTDLLGKREITYEKRMELFNAMAKYGHELHMSLKGQGDEPVHHRYMIENRGIPVDDINFYKHIHPVEDLLKFIENVHANDDPVDETIGETFYIPIYSRRWNSQDRYTIKRIETGWYIEHMTHRGDCAKDASPILYASLSHDGINYPESLPGYFEWLWDQAQEEGLNREQVQTSLNELAEWINTCEKASPKGIFEGYK